MLLPGMIEQISSPNKDLITPWGLARSYVFELARRKKTSLSGQSHTTINDKIILQDFIVHCRYLPCLVLAEGKHGGDQETAGETVWGASRGPLYLAAAEALPEHVQQAPGPGRFHQASSTSDPHSSCLNSFQKHISYWMLSVQSVTE